MTCPYCGKEMEKGVIDSPHELSWKDKRYFFGRAEFHKGSVVLSDLNYLKGSSVDAYLCRGCRKVIIDYNENEGGQIRSI
jgi:hypothetical protein